MGKVYSRAYEVIAWLGQAVRQSGLHAGKDMSKEMEQTVSFLYCYHRKEGGTDEDKRPIKTSLSNRDEIRRYLKANP